MLRSVELFAGGGGMALGMQRAGFQPEQLVEWYKPACATLRANAKLQPQLWKEDSVREMDILDWLREVPGLKLDGVDLIAGGPPCQPFSISGAHAGHNDDRNMFPAAVESIRMMRPKAFVFENVPGLLRPAFVPYYSYIQDWLKKPNVTPKDDETWDRHRARIRKSKGSDLEYEVTQIIVEAADFGVPQNRKRVFVIGVRKDVLDQSGTEFTLRTSHSREELLRAQWITGEYWERHKIKKPGVPEKLQANVQELRDQPTLDIGDTPHAWRTTRDGLADLPKPKNDVDYPSIANHRGIDGARSYRGHTGGWYEWPAKTLKAGVHGVCGGEAMIRFTDGSLRYLTVRESARVQAFPDDYTLPTVRTVAMRLLGNAVAADVARVIGDRLRELYFAAEPVEAGDEAAGSSDPAV
jgi:DNA (cytosine-5)-methyltransferase 1